AFGVPVVAVFGPTDVEQTAPVGDRQAIIRHPVECSPCLLRECPIDHRCMTRVPVEQVYEAAIKQLQPGQLERSTSRSDAFPTSAFSTVRTPLAGVTVFLDRDGTLNVERGYVTTPDELELYPGAAEAVARLKANGAAVVLITN